MSSAWTADPSGLVTPVNTRAIEPSASVAGSALRAVLVGVICHFSTQVGFAFKFPPHHISPLWPTDAILFSVLVATPLQHRWAYIVAAYASSIVGDMRAGFPVSAAPFIAAGLIEVLVATAGVRRYANGLRAFSSLRSLVTYAAIAVLAAPAISAFFAAFAGSTDSD